MLLISEQLSRGLHQSRLQRPDRHVAQVRNKTGQGVAALPLNPRSGRMVLREIRRRGD
jgi:hypothetical protein